MRDPRADLSLGSESGRNQSLAGVRCSTLPGPGDQGGLLGAGCVCRGSGSCLTSAAVAVTHASDWLPGPTGRHFLLDKVWWGGWHGGGLGPILAGAGSLPRVERHYTWSEGGPTPGRPWRWPPQNPLAIWGDRRGEPGILTVWYLECQAVCRPGLVLLAQSGLECGL